MIRQTAITGTILLLLSMLAAAEESTASNPLFQELVSQGIVLEADLRAKLPPPTMADGLDSAAQHTVIEKIIGNRYSNSDFTRDAVVAPYVLKFSDVRDGEVVARGVDLWFIVYGKLDDLANVEVLERLNTGRGKDTTLHTLTSAELSTRGIEVGNATAEDQHKVDGAAREKFVHTIASIMDRVELHQTSRCMVSRSADSVVIASMVDRRFDQDGEFPNVYRRITRSELGDISKGDAKSYSGAGSYLKATKLSHPEGAIFVEYHMTYSEPRDWFNGANLLQSKLPILLQARVRELRRQLKEIK